MLIIKTLLNDNDFQRSGSIGSPEHIQLQTSMLEFSPIYLEVFIRDFKFWSYLQNTKSYLQTNHLHGSPDRRPQTLSFPGSTNCELQWQWPLRSFGSFDIISGNLRFYQSLAQSFSAFGLWLKSKYLGSQKSNHGSIKRELLMEYDQLCVFRLDISNRVSGQPVMGWEVDSAPGMVQSQSYPSQNCLKIISKKLLMRKT